MLEQILHHIHNYFIRDSYRGTFYIENGNINIYNWEWDPFDSEKDQTGKPVISLLNDQYFKIEGSALNDGIWIYPQDEMMDESFHGILHTLAVPRMLLNLSDEIDDWMDKYGDVVNSPFQSESFGGYSYNKGSKTGAGASGAATVGWQDVFRSQLNQWRKIS